MACLFGMKRTFSDGLSPSDEGEFLAISAASSRVNHLASVAGVSN